MRECGECTLCCTLLEVHDIPSAIGETCRHCSNGCEIHPTRPRECRDYQCMWSLNDYAGEELRPDRSGIIFDKMADDVITARLETGKMINDLVWGQINAFIDEGFSVLIFRGTESKFFLRDGHTEQMVIERVYGSANLH